MKTVFVMVDIQDMFVPVIKDLDRLVSNAKILIGSARILKIPLIVTEQYPKGLGRTIDKIGYKGEVIEKMSFSCFGCDEFAGKIKGFDRAVIFGIEAHVCVLQTALDALKKGIEVHVVADAISSRSSENKQMAIERMRQSGVFIVSTEMILFQLVEKAGTEEFKKISLLVK